MKKLIILTWLLAVVASVGFAQSGMRVKDFTALPKDLTANTTGTMRKSTTDGKAAGLIKIVTTQKDFSFDGGAYGLVAVEEHPSEIWVYVPSMAQRITIMHDRFGKLVYDYPEPIESGKTYQMILDPGVGKYVTIQTSVPRSPVFLDGDSLGISPVYNAYVLYGKHKLASHNARYDGEMDLNVINDGEETVLNYTIEMEDQSKHYGKVVITTEEGADILLNGKVVGVGRYTDELYEGNYVVETSRVNCDNAKTSFTVKPQVTNEITAAAPTPHKGYLSLYTRPRDARIALDGKEVVADQKLEMNVGNHTILLKRKGYYDIEKEFIIKHNVTDFDTINMTHIQYVTPNAFYFGASFVVGTFSGVSGMVGGRFHNVDLQVNYMFGLTKSNTANYYNDADGRYVGSAQYKLNTLGAKLGYQIAFSPVFGITPQVGFAAHMLSSTNVDGKVPNHDTKAACATIGARLVYAPLQHVSLFAAPEYDVAVSKGKQFAQIADAAGFTAGGFFCHLGLMVTF